MGLRIVAFLLVALMMVSGCAVLQSSSQPQPIYRNVPDEEAGALGYFLPKGVLRIKKEGTTVTVETIYIPDANYFYSLKYIANSCAADEITISLSKNGLLKSINVTAEDKWVEIAKKLIDIGKEVAKATVLGIPSTGAMEKLKRLDVIVDPDIFIYGNTDKKEKLLSELQKYGVSIELERYGNNVMTQVTRGPEIQKGIYYRPLVPYALTFKYSPEKPTESDFAFTKTEIVLLPNGAPILALDVTRAAFVKKVTRVTFEDGILTELYINKPSEVLAFLEIPLYLVQSIVALPTELIQVKIGYSDKRTLLLQKQLNELIAWKALQEERQKQPGAVSQGGDPLATPTPASTTVKKLGYNDARTKLYQKQLLELRAWKELQEEMRKPLGHGGPSKGPVAPPKPGATSKKIAPAKSQAGPGGDPLGR